ncbi:MAG: hypothetical protein WDO19_17025 [Bacteroidota bacterium]
MAYLDSIESVETHNVIQTNTLPVVVHCNDLNYYYCKHHPGIGAAHRLITEYLAARFLRIWNLQVPDFAFVRIAQEHVPVDLGIPFRHFTVSCFGSKKIEGAADMNALIAELNSKTKNIF